MAQPDPNAPPESLILGKWTGLTNTVQQERMKPTDLLRARNVTLDDVGQISRRRGYALKKAGNFHSLFNTIDGRALCVHVDCGYLGLINPDYSFNAITQINGSDPSQGQPPLSYVQVGDTVYFSGPVDSGKIDMPSLSASAWQGSPASLWLSPVVNPTPTLPAIAGKSLGPPPNATALAYFNGKIYLAVGNVVWFTVLYTYDYVDLTEGFLPFEAPITMLGAVGDGVYVGTKEGLWWLSPSKDFRPEKAYGLMKRVKVMDSPVIPGSMVIIPGELGNPPQVGLEADTPAQVSLMFMTTTGACVAGNGGQTTNLTESKYFFPVAQSAASMYRRQDGMNQFITALQSGGQPTNNAAIGDYIDVEIIRGAKPAPPVHAGQPVPPAQVSASDGVALTDVPTYTYFPSQSGDDRITEDSNSRITEDGNQRILD